MSWNMIEIPPFLLLGQQFNQASTTLAKITILDLNGNFHLQLLSGFDI